MGTISKGILGGFSGKVGTVVGGSWKGIEYMRSRSTASKKAPTQAQLEHQAKFRLANQFVSSILGVVQLGFKNYEQKKSSYNAAVAHIMKNAIKGVYPNFEIDYEQVLISRGDLPAAMNADAVSAVAGGV